MSRTKHHGDKNKKKLYGDLWWWFKSEPKEWRKMHKTRPRRRQTHSANTALFREVDYEDFNDTKYPLDRRPHIYYW